MIHQYKLNGYNIVLDVYSGSVHLVDEVAYDIIALYETTPGRPSSPRSWPSTATGRTWTRGRSWPAWRTSTP